MKQVYDYILYDLNLKDKDSVVVGVSGGPDSMALLFLLQQIKKNRNIEIICAHINHNTGRLGQIKEQNFVEKYCLENDIKFETMTIDNYGEENFHNEARMKRYEFFERLIKENYSKYLFTAHHADDLIETILMRIVRGSTLKGYSGFSKIVDSNGYKIIRPLIDVTKIEILEYLNANKISYCQDNSNEKDVYTRNRFRKHIVPEFKKEEPNVHQKFSKFSKMLFECNEYIEKQSLLKLEEMYSNGELDIQKFLKEEGIIQTHIIYYLLEGTYKSKLSHINDKHVELVKEVILSSKANIKSDLPDGFQINKNYNKLTIESAKETKGEYNYKFDGGITLENGMTIEQVSESDMTNNYICRLSSKEIKLPLFIRSRKPGDKLVVKNMAGSKKVNDIFIDSKFSLDDRNSWPIVVDSDGKIVWLPGVKKTKFDKPKDEFYDIILKCY